MADDKKTPKTAEEKPPEKDERVEVRGPEGGRWRGGYYFTPMPQTLNLCDLTDDQRAAITGDPQLSLTIRRD